MDDEIYIDDLSIFNEAGLYQFLVDLQKDHYIEDLTELLQFCLNNERHDLYLTVKTFIANDLET